MLQVPTPSSTASTVPKTTFLGHVTAPNRETALAKAYDEFNITTPAERKRIIVQRMSRA
jgi:hypothetical protein